MHKLFWMGKHVDACWCCVVNTNMSGLVLYHCCTQISHVPVCKVTYRWFCYSLTEPVQVLNVLLHTTCILILAFTELITVLIE